jgi:hypothetical protein
MNPEIASKTPAGRSKNVRGEGSAMVHGPCTIQITYNDPDLGPLALGGLTGVDQALVTQAWLRLRGAAPSGRWQARLFDEHQSLLEERAVDSVAADRLLGGLNERLAQARGAADVR